MELEKVKKIASVVFGKSTKETVASISEAWSRLPARYRTVMVYHYIHGESISAIAYRLGISSEVALKDCHRAIYLLKHDCDELYGKVSRRVYSVLSSRGVFILEYLQIVNAAELMACPGIHYSDILALNQLLTEAGFRPLQGSAFMGMRLDGAISDELYALLQHYRSVEELAGDKAYVSIEGLPYHLAEELEGLLKCMGYPNAHLTYKRGVGPAICLRKCGECVGERSV